MRLTSLLNQTKVWQDNHGNFVRIKDMELDYIYNVLALLERKADKIPAMMDRDMFADLLRLDVPDEVLHWHDVEVSKWRENPKLMMRTSPLYLSLFARALKIHSKAVRS
jgi:hypothetical protein